MPVFPSIHPPRSVRAVLLATAVLAVGAWGAGCSPKKTLAPNIPPQTTLFVQGPVDTVNHLVHLYWFGSDVDGYVAGFQLRLLNPAAPAESQWVSTPRTDSLFAVFTPSGLTTPVFEVRAIDDDGAVDLTPATQTFTFSNQAPSITLVSPPRMADSTFASVTLTWIAADVDGDGTKLRYLVWLDGNQAGPNIVTAKTFTIPTAQFLVAGQLLSGYRSVYVQALDDGGRAGNIDSTRWYVRAPVSGTRARLLVIDDVPSANPANFTIDTLMTNTVARNVPGDQYSLMRLEFTQPFRSVEDVRQTLSLFETVIWYRGTQTNFSTLLSDYHDGIAEYVEAGGSFFIEGVNLVDGLQAAGPLPNDWVTRYLGSRGLLRHETSVPGDSSATWGVGNARMLYSSTLVDSLRVAGNYSGLRGFDVVDTTDVLLWAPPGTLTEPHSFAVPIAVSVQQPGGGRMTLISAPMRGLDGLRTAPRVLAKIFEKLGLTGP